MVESFLGWLPLCLTSTVTPVNVAKPMDCAVNVILASSTRGFLKEAAAFESTPLMRTCEEKELSPP